MNRRTLITGVGAAAVAGVGYSIYRSSRGDEILAEVAPTIQWHSTDLEKFLNGLEVKEIKLINESLGFEGPFLDAVAIKREIVSRSSHFLTAPFKDKEEFDYHDIVRWVGKEYDIKTKALDSASTYKIERLIFEEHFIRLWDSLNEEQRMQYLKEAYSTDSFEDIAGIASLSGGAALAALATAVSLSGFAFYTGMSTFICSAASLLGATLPFSGYMAASSTVAFLAGPAGWILGGLIAIGGLVFLGFPDAKKLAPLVIITHCLKANRLNDWGHLRSVNRELKIT